MTSVLARLGRLFEKPVQRKVRETVRAVVAHHQEGLRRVSAVIDGSPYYDKILAHRLSDDILSDFSLDRPLMKRKACAKTLARQALQKRGRMILPIFADFACDGVTPNNEREFAFFDRICAPIGLHVSGSNYGKLERKVRPPNDRDWVDTIDSLTADLDAFYEARSDIQASLVQQINAYSCAFLSYLQMFTAADSILPKVLVQANDHSPARVALSMVMKSLGIPRVYLQHAEVTSHFPPLDFEYSVLRNERSLRIYESIGPVSGQTFILPRESKAPDLQRLAEPLRDPVRVVIYPTSRILIQGLSQVLDGLRQNSTVSEILIKQHPSAVTPLEKSDTITGIDLIDAFPNGPHVAIVGNSAVAVELLAQGIPVYQNFDFDAVERDYYGLVQVGLTREVRQEDLGNRFWTQYAVNKPWLDEFKNWMPSYEDTSDDRAAFVSAMAELRT